MASQDFSFPLSAELESEFSSASSDIWGFATQNAMLSSDAVLSSYGQRSPGLLGDDVQWASLHSDSDSSAKHEDDAEMAELFNELQKTAALSPSPPPTSPDARPLQDHAGLVIGLSARESQTLIRSLGGDVAVAPKAAVSVRPRILPKKPKVEAVVSFPRPVKLGPGSKRRLARSPSPTESVSSFTSHSSNWGSSNSKQAVYAKEYRAANKKKMSEMEVEIARLKADNDRLNSKVTAQSAREEELNGEIVYLKSVLHHDSKLAGLLSGLQSSGRLSFAAADAAAASPAKRASRRKAPGRLAVDGGAGICLHVQDSGVSVEFCSKCNARSHDRSD